ncbi:MAG: hypothetical protein HGA78_04265, partial [Nitrospirales bacterium]|nr:hypothetical protein [Nitrospirales bacterium]
MLNKLKLLQRILLGYSIPILLSILVAAFVYVSAVSVEKQSNSTGSKYSIVILTTQLNLDIATMGRFSRSYVIEKNERYRKAIDDAEKKFNSTMDSLKKIVIDPRQQEALSAIDAAKAEFIGVHQEIISLVHQGKEAEALFEPDAAVCRLNRALRHSADAEDRRLRRIEHRGE